MEKKKQLVKLLAMLAASSSLFVLAGCGGEFLSEFGCVDKSWEGGSVKGISVPGFCFNSHKVMIGSVEEAVEVDEEAGNQEGAEDNSNETANEGSVEMQGSSFVTCDSTYTESSCLGCGEVKKSCYTMLNVNDISSWSCTFKGCDSEEKAIGCFDGCIKVEDTHGLGGMSIDALEFLIGIE